MTDLHMRILRQVARQSQRELSGYDDLEHATRVATTSRRGIATTSRREYLARAATRTRAQVTDAQQRRSRQVNGHGATQDRVTAPTVGRHPPNHARPAPPDPPGVRKARP